MGTHRETDAARGQTALCFDFAHGRFAKAKRGRNDGSARVRWRRIAKPVRVVSATPARARAADLTATTMRRRRAVGVAAVLLISCGCILGSVARAQSTPRDQNATPIATAGTLSGRVNTAFVAAKNTVEVDIPGYARALPLTCATPACATNVSVARAGDAVTVTVNDLGTPKSITSVASVQRAVSVESRLIAFIVSFAILFVAMAVATRGKPLSFLVGVDNRYSNSQVQMVLWFGAVATMYLGLVVLRVHALGWDFLGGVGITQNLALVTGLSALSFGGAKVITLSKITAAQQAGRPAVKVPSTEPPNLLTDLFMNDNKVADFGDFQMILVTVAAVAIFVSQAAHDAGSLLVTHAATLPDVDSSLLAGFGIGQGAYLVKKAAVGAGQG
jgi:hypothetical protein